MVITVRLHTTLQRKTPHGLQSKLTIALPKDSSLADLLQKLEISQNPTELILVVNQRVCESDQTLTDGDQVDLIPAISGGDQ